MEYIHLQSGTLQMLIFMAILGSYFYLESKFDLCLPSKYLKSMSRCWWDVALRGG